MEKKLITEKSKDYELLDSGNGEKLERYGGVIVSRPDPQALWQKSKPDLWEKADAVFVRGSTSGKWQRKNEPKNDWIVSFDGLSFKLELLPSKHLGVFPEQVSHWKWLEEKISQEVAGGKKVQVLNLFGYTGGASLACARAGAEVCHVDASKFAVDLAHINLGLSNLSDRKVRFIVDDVRKFVEREIKRGSKYDLILMDPPVYGKGAKGEVWKIEEEILPFITRLKAVLSNDPVAVILNGYSSVYSHTTYENVLTSLVSELGGTLVSGELNIKQSDSDRLLPAGIFARWSKN